MKNRTRTCLLTACVILLAMPISAAQPPASQTGTYARLKTRIDRIWLIDTHEHLPNEAERLRAPDDCLMQMTHYVNADLVSAGMPALPSEAWRTIVNDPTRPFDQRWAAFSKWWPEVRLTGYGRMLERCARDAYGARVSTGSRPKRAWNGTAAWPRLSGRASINTSSKTRHALRSRLSTWERPAWTANSSCQCCVSTRLSASILPASCAACRSRRASTSPLWKTSSMR